MKRINMTQLARQAKSVVSDAIESPILVITPSRKEDVVIISESYLNSLKGTINLLATTVDELKKGKSLSEVAAEHISKLKGDSHLQEELLK